MPLRSPSLRSQAARIAGLTLHLNGDSAAIASRARRGFDARFEGEIAQRFPDLARGSETFRLKVRLARRIYFARLARASVTARRRKSPRAPVAGTPTPVNDNAATGTGDGAAARSLRAATEEQLNGEHQQSTA